LAGQWQNKMAVKMAAILKRLKIFTLFSPAFFSLGKKQRLTAIYPEKSTVRVAWLRPVNGSIPEREVLAGEVVVAVCVVLDVGTGRVFFLQVVKLHRDGLPVWTRQT